MTKTFPCERCDTPVTINDYFEGDEHDEIVCQDCHAKETDSQAVHKNRSNRRSGGSKRAVIKIGRGGSGPLLSIQCFEGRHGECFGKCVFFGSKCECSCHGLTKPK